MDSGAPLWEPTAADREHATMTAFMRWVGEREGGTFADYEELRPWSVEELEDFWAGDLGVLRGARLAALRAGAERPHDARGTLV